MDNSANHARIGKRELPVVRHKLRAWLVLEDIQSKISKAAKAGDKDEFVSSLYSYVSTAFSIPVEELEQCYWLDIATAYAQGLALDNLNSNLPLIKPILDKRPDESEMFDYPGRSWYMWANIFSSAYGWSLEYIAELDVNDAVALYQEILIDNQHEKEWDWMLSENAYSYDSNTKKSKFIPLNKPEWMRTPREIKEIPTFRIRKSELPVGLILRWDDGKTSQPQ